MTEQPKWLPTMFTPSLTGTEEFPTEGDWLIPFVEKYVRLEGSKTPIVLDDYQKWLLRHFLELYPEDHEKYAGQLRFTQICCSLARQNGKSVIGLCMVVYFLLRRDARIISLASQKSQADIIYDKVKYAILQEPGFLKRYKPTGTRGVNPKTGRVGSYAVFAGNGDSLQGEAAGFVMFDELHISKEEAYDAMLDGISAQKSAQILGITTAGDDDSTLLKRLYETGKKAVRKEEGYNERFGFFLWEAPEHLDIYDPEAIMAANPSLASGASRLDIDAEIAKMKEKPEHHSRRFRLNQFVSSENVWMSLSKWYSVAAEGITKNPWPRDIVFAVDRAPGREFASITAAVRRKDGVVETEVIATYENPTLEWLEQDCAYLYKTYKGRFFMDSNVLKDLHTKLKDRKIPVEYLTSNQMMNATATVYQMTSEKRIVHANDPIILKQLPRAVTKNVGDGHKVSRKKSAGHVDAVIATIMAVYGAEIQKTRGPALFIHE